MNMSHQFWHVDGALKIALTHSLAPGIPAGAATFELPLPPLSAGGRGAVFFRRSDFTNSNSSALEGVGSPARARRYLAARALSIARRSAAASGVTSLGKKATTLPSLPTTYLAKFHAGRWPMPLRNL